MVTTCGNLDSCRLVEEESNKYFDIQFRGEGIGAIASKANGLIAEVAPGPMRTCYAHDREEYNCRQCDQRQDGRFTAYLAEPQQQQQEEENAMQDAEASPDELIWALQPDQADDKAIIEAAIEELQSRVDFATTDYLLDLVEHVDLQSAASPG